MRILLVLFTLIVVTACTTTPRFTLSPQELWDSGVYPVNIELKNTEIITQGQLDNGLRYFLINNTTPANQVVMRMHVGVGSIHEVQGELGLAHLLEHMAFNGSQNVPEGEMVKILERFGLSFGADTNASTSFTETIYSLDLPSNDSDIIDTSLFLFRETASNLTIDASALADEIPVVLAEHDARSTIQTEGFFKQLEAWAQGTLFIERNPKGDKSQLSAMTSSMLRDFYQRYYAPNNTALVIVGDFDVDQMQSRIEDKFADWQAHPSALDTEAVNIGAVTTYDDVQVNTFLADGLTTQVSINWSTPYQLREDSIDTRRDMYLNNIANNILNYRLNTLLLSGKAPFEGAIASHSNMLNHIELSQIIAVTQPQNWQAALTALVTEKRKIMEFGVTQQELEREVSTYRNMLFTAVQQKDTIQSGQLAQMLLGYHAMPMPFALLSPDDEFALFEALMFTFSVDEINDILQTRFTRTAPVIFVQSDTQLAAEETSIKDAFLLAYNLPIIPDEVVEKEVFAYTDFGPSGEIVSKQYDDAYDVTSVVFANGVHLNIKPTELQQGRAVIDLSIGDGFKSLTPNDIGLKEMYGFKVAGGLGKHSTNSLRELFADIDISFNFAPRFWAWGGTFTPSVEHLALQLQVMAAFTTDAAWDPALFNLYQQNKRLEYQSRYSSVEAVQRFNIDSILYDDDVRVSVPELDVLLQKDFSAIDAFFQQQLQQGPITLSVVGDVDVEEAIEQVALTFGALPLQVNAPERWRVDNLRFNAPQVKTLTHQGNPNTASLLTVYKTRDNSDIRENNVLNILKSVLYNKVLESIRERLGAAYSPSVSNTQSRYVLDDGFMFFNTQSSPAEIDLVRDTTMQIIAQVKQPGGITADELSRALQPQLANIEQAEQSNYFWINRLRLLHTEPDALSRWETLPDLLKSITVEELQTAARRYLVEDNKVEITILPE